MATPNPLLSGTGQEMLLLSGRCMAAADQGLVSDAVDWSIFTDRGGFWEEGSEVLGKLMYVVGWTVALLIMFKSIDSSPFWEQKKARTKSESFQNYTSIIKGRCKEIKFGKICLCMPSMFYLNYNGTNRLGEYVGHELQQVISSDFRNSLDTSRKFMKDKYRIKKNIYLSQLVLRAKNENVYICKKYFGQHFKWIKMAMFLRDI